ncbi:hypothetical protein BDQ17DRAFT_1333704 [Cyathus striatus]|nr:hypothetical protein BDQ17DRAFT_1333704 [Cyathus striatus]
MKLPPPPKYMLPALLLMHLHNLRLFTELEESFELYGHAAKGDKEGKEGEKERQVWRGGSKKIPGTHKTITESLLCNIATMWETTCPQDFEMCTEHYLQHIG